ncbi:ATP-binding protein [Haloquadratum walsbyi]|jgi:DNA topoisomerase VI, subunit B|uniref:Type 2 DNA topoisomerase 6 subunit B n=1 Tax=Haloquadratum walsbyi J07HQW2 TaxID=1238425 RepID=U1MWM0_9EURY|nr:ATP-binding protein [Haloquadratum walsbyi]ERG94844.1 MAG: DNA topoisomerase VI, subunit B [Haloquadratum walsbyi J07HQW2]
MTSFQSELGEESEIADELAESQRAISIAEFFEKNKHMLGFDSGARGLVTAVKEAVDNALDATEEAGIKPDISIEIRESGDYYTLIVEDNGPGITREQVPKVFGKLLYGSRFHAREQSLTPNQTLLVRRDGDVTFTSISELCDSHLLEDGPASAPIPADSNIEVPSFNRTTHEMTWQPVTNAIRHRTDEDVYRVSTACGRTVEITGNHSLFSLSSSGETIEVNASELSPGDNILAPKQLPVTPESTDVREAVDTEPQAGEKGQIINILDYIQLADLQESEYTFQIHGVDEASHSSVGDHHTSSCAAKMSSSSSMMASTGVASSSGQQAHFSADRQHSKTDIFDSSHKNNESRISVKEIIECNEASTVADHTLEIINPDGETARLPVSVPIDDIVTSHLTKYITSESTPAVSHTSNSKLDNSTPDEFSEGTTTPLESIISLICESAGEIRLPSFIFECDSEHQQQLLTKLYQHSETPNKTAASNDVATYTTSSETFARQLTTLWNMNGVVATTDTRTETIAAESERTVYEVSVDQAEVEVVTDNEPDYQQHNGDLCLLSVNNIEQIDAPPYVYDISVPGASGHDENFVVTNDGAICVKNSRGQQGIGISAAVLYSQLTSGKPARITTRTQSSDTAQYFELIIDTDTNEPEVSADRERDPGAASLSPTHGTRIELEMEANMRARGQLRDYVKDTAVVNPHARITLDEPGLEEPRQYERVDGAELPAQTEEIRPHPHGVELGTLLKMLEATESYSVSGFLREEFTRVGSKTATKILNRFRDRHFGRALPVSAPETIPSDVADVDDTDDTLPSSLESIIEVAVVNKGASATAEFADRVAKTLNQRSGTTRAELVKIVDTVAEDIEDEFETTFGTTVRENAVDAAWDVLTVDIDDDIYPLVADATSTQKNHATVRGVADRVAAKFADDSTSLRATQDTVREYVDRSADMIVSEEVSFGETARENVVNAVWKAMQTVEDELPAVKTIADDRNIASELLDAMRSTDILAPPTDCLSPITSTLVEAGLRKEFDADFYAAATRDAEVHGGDPFVVEAGIAYGGELNDGNISLLRFANRVPLVYQRGACATTDVIKSIGWRNYGLDQPGGSGMPRGPAVVMIHVASTNVPFTSESKDALANIPAIEDEIELAVREASRDLKSYLNKRRSMQKRRKKQDVLGRILPEMANKLADVTENDRPEIDNALARIMNNVNIERDVDNGSVTLTVQNYSDSQKSPTLTDIVDTKPDTIPDEIELVELEDEYFVTWEPVVGAGESVTVTYEVPAEASFELDVDGVESEKLTIDA